MGISQHTEQFLNEALRSAGAAAAPAAGQRQIQLVSRAAVG